MEGTSSFQFSTDLFTIYCLFATDFIGHSLAAILAAVSTAVSDPAKETEQNEEFKQAVQDGGNWN